MKGKTKKFVNDGTTRPTDSIRKIKRDARFKPVERVAVDKASVNGHVDERFSERLREHQSHQLVQENEFEHLEHIETAHGGEITGDINVGDVNEVTIPITRRLALVNYELWDCVVAADLFVMFSSFLEAEQKLEKLTIYISEIGKKYTRADISPDLWSNSTEETKKGGNDLDRRKVQEYKRLQRHFFYAILELDSVHSAERIYQTCDGVETDFSLHPLEIHAVPNECVFSEESIRDTCDVFPVNYSLPPVLHAIASKIEGKRSSLNRQQDAGGVSTHEYEKFYEGDQASENEHDPSMDVLDAFVGIDEMWDVTDPKRTAALSSAFSAMDDMAMNDLDAYVASDADEGRDSAPNAGMSKYASLLEGYTEEIGSEGEIPNDVPAQDTEANEQEESVSGDLTAEFTVSDDIEKDRIKRHAMEKMEIKNAQTLGDKSRLKRRMKKKLRKEALKQAKFDSEILNDSHESDENDNGNAEKESVTPKVAHRKTVRKAHKQRKQKAAKEERYARQRRRVEHLTGFQYDEGRPTTPERKLHKVDDGRFATRLASERDFHIDPSLRPT